jgi:hypothetical protein
LELAPETVGIHPSDEHPKVWGALMELGMPEGVATLVALADGTTSMYTSTGGGTIGAGEHESVARQAHVFLRTIEEHLDALDDQEASLPSAGDVHLRALTYAGSLGAIASSEELARARGPLSAVFFAGHNVITAIRKLEQG